MSSVVTPTDADKRNGSSKAAPVVTPILDDEAPPSMLHAAMTQMQKKLEDEAIAAAVNKTLPMLTTPNPDDQPPSMLRAAMARMHKKKEGEAAVPTSPTSMASPAEVSVHFGDEKPTLQIEVSRWRFLGFVGTATTISLVFTVVFLIGIPVRNHVLDEIGQSDHADQVVENYNTASGYIMACVSIFVGMLYDSFQSSFWVFLYNVPWFPGENPSQGIGAVKKIALVVVPVLFTICIENSMSALQASQTTIGFEHIMSAPDLTYQDPLIFLRKNTTKTNGTAVEDTILKNALRQKTDPFVFNKSSVCVKTEESAKKNPSLQLCAQDISATSVIYGFSGNDWNREAIPKSLSPNSSVKIQYGRFKKAPKNFSAGSFDISTALEIFLQGKMLLERSISDSTKAVYNCSLSDGRTDLDQVGAPATGSALGSGSGGRRRRVLMQAAASGSDAGGTGGTDPVAGGSGSGTTGTTGSNTGNTNPATGGSASVNTGSVGSATGGTNSAATASGSGHAGNGGSTTGSVGSGFIGGMGGPSNGNGNGDTSNGGFGTGGSDNGFENGDMGSFGAFGSDFMGYIEMGDESGNQAFDDWAVGSMGDTGDPTQNTVEDFGDDTTTYVDDGGIDGGGLSDAGLNEWFVDSDGKRKCVGAISSLLDLKDYQSLQNHNLDYLIENIAKGMERSVPAFSRDEIEVSLEKYQINEQLLLELVAIDVVLDPNIRYSETPTQCAPDDKTWTAEKRKLLCNPLVYLYLEKNTFCGADKCVFLDFSKSIDFRKQVTMMPFMKNCSTSDLRYSADFQTFFPSGCNAQSDSVFLYGLGSYVSAQEFGSDFQKTGYPYLLAPRRHLQLAFGKLSWQLQDLASQFGAECGIGTKKTSNSSASANKTTSSNSSTAATTTTTVTASSTTTTTNVSKCMGLAHKLDMSGRWLFAGNSSLPLTKIMRSDFRQPIPLVTLNERSVYLSTISDSINFERLNTKFITVSKWNKAKGQTLSNENCSMLMDSFMKQIDNNNFFLEDPVQSMYTSALFYLFQDAGITEVNDTKLISQANQLTTDSLNDPNALFNNRLLGDEQIREIRVMIPSTSAIPTYIGCGIIGFFLLLALVVPLPALRFMPGANAAQKFMEVLGGGYADQVYKKSFVYVGDGDENAIGEINEFTPKAITLVHNQDKSQVISIS